MRPRAFVFVLAAALAGLAPIARAQVQLSGVLQPSGPTLCQQGETHLFECTDVFFKSSSVNLSQWEGKPVTVTGTNIGLLCTVYEVTAIQDATVSFTIQGTPTVGGTITLDVCISGVLVAPYRVFVSRAYDHVPLAGGLGTQLIADPATLIAVGTTAGGCGQQAFRIPNDPALVGVTFYAQAAGRHATWELSNSVCATVQ